MQIARIVTLMSMAATMSMAAVAPASAEETTCRGRIGARTVDNLRVPLRGDVHAGGNDRKRDGKG